MDRGGARTIRGKHYARARFGKGLRIEQGVPWAKSEEEAKAVAVIIAELAEMLVGAKRHDLVKGMAKEVAYSPDPKHQAKVRKAIESVVSGAVNAGAGRSITFEEWGDRYTSGRLSKQHPDHVRVKNWKDDASRLKRYVYPHVGGVPVHAFTVAHGNLVMAKLPAMSPANRRHVAQIMSRLLHLAVYPGQLLPANPLPRGWLPKPPKNRRHHSYLYPREEALFLAHEPTPVAFRLLIGVLNREGMRLSELLDSEWWQWNLAEGTFTVTRTKTGDPRMWALKSDVTMAMRLWRKARPKVVRPFAEVLKWCPDRSDLAQRLRDALRSSGVSRVELFESTEHTAKLRVHDMRATFVTLSIAEGRTETWIRDRTGHKSTYMVDRYRRAARQATELKLGALGDLACGLGWETHPPGENMGIAGSNSGGSEGGESV